jgi:hypothetical protein
MIGTQRSGSNLLRLMLNQLPDIVAPHPPHILQRLMPLVDKYGDLTRNENFISLVDDVCRLVELNPVPWEGVILNRLNTMGRCRDRSLVAVFIAVYDELARVRGAKTWCCKSLANIHYLDDIESYFDVQGGTNPGLRGTRVEPAGDVQGGTNPGLRGTRVEPAGDVQGGTNPGLRGTRVEPAESDAKYIYLYRDGRDVAVSFRKAVVGEKHSYHIAKEWAGTQRLALRLREKIGPERFFSVSYEDITGKPEQTMRALCRFLGRPFTSAMLDFHQSDEAKRAAESSELWSNVTRPLMANNTRKFLREATGTDIRIFESVAGDVLDALGYERVAVTRGREHCFSEEELREFDQENRRLKDEMLLGTDAEDAKRRDRQAALLAEIRARSDTDSGRLRLLSAIFPVAVTEYRVP